jgi:hypothetical protein
MPTIKERKKRITKRKIKKHKETVYQEPFCGKGRIIEHFHNINRITDKFDNVYRIT